MSEIFSGFRLGWKPVNFGAGWTHSCSFFVKRAASALMLKLAENHIGIHAWRGISWQLEHPYGPNGWALEQLMATMSTTAKGPSRSRAGGARPVRGCGKIKTESSGFFCHYWPWILKVRTCGDDDDGDDGDDESKAVSGWWTNCQHEFVEWKTPFCKGTKVRFNPQISTSEHKLNPSKVNQNGQNLTWSRFHHWM